MSGKHRILFFQQGRITNLISGRIHNLQAGYPFIVQQIRIGPILLVLTQRVQNMFSEQEKMILFKLSWIYHHRTLSPCLILENTKLENDLFIAVNQA